MAEPVGRTVKGFRFRCRAERAAGGRPLANRKAFARAANRPFPGRDAGEIYFAGLFQEACRRYDLSAPVNAMRFTRGFVRQALAYGT